MEKKIDIHKSSVFIETYGCQMNKYDSEIIAGILAAGGYNLVEKPETADIVLINTCSVRDHAEQRALGKIGVLYRWKKNAPLRKIGVIGCMAQRMSEELLQNKPIIDFIIGPDQYRKLPEILQNGTKYSCVHTHINNNEIYENVTAHREPGISGWVAIMRGCNNFCSYCIVPYTRGRERSRSADAICREITHMTEQGYREVTLLGQNVNSYNNGHKDFSELLKMVGRIKDIFRIRFITSHPKDLSDKLLKTIVSEEKVCPHIHLPVQSGSNRILKLMNRGYTKETFIKLVEKARSLIPDLAITTDIMVGFPGETESDFMDTYQLMENIRFDDAFTYRYSARKGTKAAKMEDHLTETERLNRLDQIIKLQRRINLEKKQSLIGRSIEVLPERTSKQSSQEWMGKTDSGHVVIFPKDNISLGQPVKVLIEKLKGSTLRGKILTAKFLS